MSKEIEIEFKNLITKHEYERLQEELNLKNKLAFKQTNYYFDTPNMLLKKHYSALRIRSKNNAYVLTLKEPHDEGLLETHQKVTSHELEQAIAKGILPDGEISQKIKQLNNNKSFTLNYLGELKTVRLETEILEGILVLDKSHYLNVTDYELEFECTDATKGTEFFERFLSKYRIPKRTTANKIQRFMDEKSKRNWEEHRENKLDQ